MAVELGHNGVLKPGQWRWLRAFAWGVALFVLVAVAFSFPYGFTIMAELPGHPVPSAKVMAAAPAGSILVAVLVGLACALAVYTLAVRFAERRPLVEFALPHALPELGIGLLVGFVLMTLAVGALWLFGWDRVTSAHPSAILRAFDVTLQSSVFEETLLRLVAFRLLWRAFGVWPALALSALLFGALHLANPNSNWFAAICIAFEAGILLAAFYVLTGRAWMSIGVHAGWNFTQGWLYGAAVSGTSEFAGGPLVTQPVASTPQWLSGGGFGPEASLAALVICTVAGVYVLWLAWRRNGMRPAD